MRGLEQDEFLPFYQFQFDAGTLDIVGAETLARWNHPERGILAPGVFLATAEEIGAVADIDGIILEKAIADLDRWKALGVDMPKLSVNVSSRRLHDPALKQKLNALPLPTGIISFELLESIFLDENDEQAMDNLLPAQAERRSGDRRLRHRPCLDRQPAPAQSEDAQNRSGTGTEGGGFALAPQPCRLDHRYRPVARYPGRGGRSGDVWPCTRSALGCDVLQGFGLAMPMAFDDTVDFIRRQAWRRTDLP